MGGQHRLPAKVRDALWLLDRFLMQLLEWTVELHAGVAAQMGRLATLRLHHTWWEAWDGSLALKGVAPTSGR
ncbi:hypothetical protein ACH4C6_33635 [Streptomyces sp. NPDC017943]|uniref:hypothetical protein n=1 Tax=Streptomyces sp. NPDC017943 TaxID=3365019 RepID=UPI00379B393B